MSWHRQQPGLRLDERRRLTNAARRKNKRQQQLHLRQACEQISWHREWVDTGSRAEKAIPPVTKEPDLAEGCYAAVVRHNTSPPFQQHAQEALKNFDEEMVTEIYAEDEVEDEGDEEVGTAGARR